MTGIKVIRRISRTGTFHMPTMPLNWPMQRKDARGDTNAYQLALAHSRRVKRLKILLPLAAVAISAIFIAISIVRTWLPDNIQIQGATVEDGKIVMERPAISGRNKKGINYSMLAEKALQDVKNPNLITLKNINAAMPVGGDVIARVKASSADFNRSADTLSMTEPFTINLDNGTRANFQSAELDVKGGTLMTEKPIAVYKDKASILAQSFKMTDKGSTIVFTGQVRVHVDASAIHSNDGKKPGAQ